MVEMPCVPKFQLLTIFLLLLFCVLSNSNVNELYSCQCPGKLEIQSGPIWFCNKSMGFTPQTVYKTPPFPLLRHSRELCLSCSFPATALYMDKFVSPSSSSSSSSSRRDPPSTKESATASTQASTEEAFNYMPAESASCPRRKPHGNPNPRRGDIKAGIYTEFKSMVVGLSS